MKYIATIGNHEYLVEIIDDHTVILDGKSYTVDFDSINDQPVYSLLLDGHSYESYVYPSNEGMQVILHGHQYLANVEDERERRLRVAAGGKVSENTIFHLKAPMPGLAVAVPVKDGQEVAAGEVLVILESMKMQNELKSPRAGKVSRLRVNSGDRVEQRQALLSVI